MFQNTFPSVKSRLLICHMVFVIQGLTAVAVAQSGADTIVQTEGGSLRGSILRVSKNAVEIEADGNAQTVPVDKIRFVILAGEPRSLLETRKAVDEGNYEQAVRYVDRIKQDTFDRELVAADVQFYRAFIQAKRGLEQGDGLVDAARSVLAFVKAFPDSFHFYGAAEVLGDLAVSLGKHANAAKYYAQLEKSPFPSLQLRGAMRAAEALRAEGKLSEALTRYQAVASADESGPAAENERVLAVLGMATCQAELGQFEEGINAVEALLSGDVNDPETLARAHLALGACYRVAKRPKDAVLAYLRVDLLYPVNPDLHAEALFHLSQLLTEVGYPQRAQEAKEKLNSSYAGTRWAAK